MALDTMDVIQFRLGEVKINEGLILYYLTFDPKEKFLSIELVREKEDWSRDKLKQVSLEKAETGEIPSAMLSEAKKYARIVEGIEEWCRTDPTLEGRNPKGFCFNDVRNLSTQTSGLVYRELEWDLFISVLKIAGEKLSCNIIGQLSGRSAMAVEEAIDGLPFPSAEQAIETLSSALELMISPIKEKKIL